MRLSHDIEKTVLTILVVSTCGSFSFGQGEESIRGEYRVGVEWVRDYSKVGKPYVPNRKPCAEGFYNSIKQLPNWKGVFNWGDANAWEKDFKRADKGGTDHVWVDNVHFAYFAGHGAGPGHVSTGVGTGGGFTFGVNQHDDWVLGSVPPMREAQWGDKHLNWIVLDVCSALAVKYWGDDTAYPLSKRWANSDVMKGLHFIFGFRNSAHDNGYRGKVFADFITGNGVSKKYPVRLAWRYATLNTEDGNVISASLCAASPGADPSNEHIYGQGVVSKDPDPAQQTYYVSSWPCSF